MGVKVVIKTSRFQHPSPTSMLSPITRTDAKQLFIVEFKCMKIFHLQCSTYVFEFNYKNSYLASIHVIGHNIDIGDGCWTREIFPWKQRENLIHVQNQHHFVPRGIKLGQLQKNEWAEIKDLDDWLTSADIILHFVEKKREKNWRLILINAIMRVWLPH